MTYRIKHVELTDDNHKTVVDLDEVCFPGDHRIRPRYNDRQWWFAYSETGKVVGYAGMSITSDKSAYLCRIGVVPKHRRGGLAHRLMMARLSYARKLGLKVVVTFTSPDNHASMNNLIRHGFTTYLPDYAWAGAWSVYWWKDL